MEKNTKKYLSELIREIYENNGKQYYRYYVNCQFMNSVKKVLMQPVDIDGYDLLDMVFNGSDKTALYHENGEFTSSDGKVIKTDKYFVSIVDTTNNAELECPVKPYSSSAKSLLKVMVQIAENKEQINKTLKESK